MCLDCNLRICSHPVCVGKTELGFLSIDDIDGMSGSETQT